MTENNSKAGRKSLYTDALAETICNQIASGKTLKSICALPNMPSERTVHDWLKQEDKAAFSQSYGVAKLIQYDILWDSTIDIARGDRSNDSMIKIQRDALEIKTVTNYVGKLNPAKYGANPSPIIVANNGVNPAKLTNAELDIYLELLKKMKDDN